jgi:hypothetical protein
MLALIHNTVVSKMPIIKYICQHTLDARRVPLFTTRRLWRRPLVLRRPRVFTPLAYRKAAMSSSVFVPVAYSSKARHTISAYFLSTQIVLVMHIVDIADRCKARTMPPRALFGAVLAWYLPTDYRHTV